METADLTQPAQRVQEAQACELRDGLGDRGQSLLRGHLSASDWLVLVILAGFLLAEAPGRAQAPPGG